MTGAVSGGRGSRGGHPLQDRRQPVEQRCQQREQNRHHRGILAAWLAGLSGRRGGRGRCASAGPASRSSRPAWTARPGRARRGPPPRCRTARRQGRRYRVQAGERPHHRVGGLLLLVGEAGSAPARRASISVGEPGVPPEQLVRVALVRAVPGLRHHQDRHLPDPRGQLGAEPDGRAELLQRVPNGRRVEHRVERPGQAAGTAGQGTARGPWPRGPPRISRYKSTCSVVIWSEDRTARRIGGSCPP